MYARQKQKKKGERKKKKKQGKKRERKGKKKEKKVLIRRYVEDDDDADDAKTHEACCGIRTGSEIALRRSYRCKAEGFARTFVVCDDDIDSSALHGHSLGKCGVIYR